MIEVARGAAGIISLRVIASAIGFICSALMARMLGANGLGVLAYVTAWLGVITIPATLGLNQLLPREVARYKSQGEWGLLRGILDFSQRSVIAISIALAGPAALLVWIASGYQTSSATVVTFWIALLTLPVSGLIQIRQSTMRGLGYVAKGMLPETLVAPTLNLIILATLYFALNAKLSPPQAISIGIPIAIISFLFGNRMLHYAMPSSVYKAGPEEARRVWLESALPMMMIAGLEIINSQTDIIMLGAMTSESETGIYSVALRGATLATFVLASVNMAIGPIIARNHYGGNHASLQDIVRKSAIAIFLFTFVICAGLYMYGGQYLRLFGPEFIAGRTALNILLSGKLYVALAGSVGLILKMTGYERVVVWTGSAAAIANIILNAILIPSYGADGAAIATTLSLIIWATGSGLLIYWRLRINPTIFVSWRSNSAFGGKVH